MTHLEFIDGMSRVMERFGKKRYTTDVNQQIWEAWQDHPANSWQRLVNDFLIRKTTPPVPIDFIQAAKAESSRKLNLVPRTEAKKHVSIFGELEKAQMFETAKHASRGQINKRDLKMELRVLQRSIDERSTVKCRNCSDEGIISASLIGERSNPYVFKCDCSAGRFRSEDWPQWNSGMRRQYVPADETFRKELAEDDGPPEAS